MAQADEVIHQSTRLKLMSVLNAMPEGHGLDFKRLKAYCGTKRVELTDREFEILHCLAERAGQVVTRDELLHLVWGYSDTPLTRTVDNFIFRLRHKLEPDPRHPIYIRKAYGDGYRLITE